MSCPQSSFSRDMSALPILSSPIHTFWHAFQRQTLCPQETSSWRVSFSRRKNKVSIYCHLDRFHVFLKDHTAVQQVVVEAGWRRGPQHPSLHKARNINVIIQCLQDLGFLHYPREFCGVFRKCTTWSQRVPRGMKKKKNPATGPHRERRSALDGRKISPLWVAPKCHPCFGIHGSATSRSLRLGNGNREREIGHSHELTAPRRFRSLDLVAPP